MVKLSFSFVGLAALVFLIGIKNTAVLSIETVWFLIYLAVTFFIFLFIFSLYANSRKERPKGSMKLKKKY